MRRRAAQRSRRPVLPPPHTVVQDKCPDDSAGRRVPQGACELLYQQTAHDGRGVVMIASGNSLFGEAGKLPKTAGGRAAGRAAPHVQG